MSKKKPKAIIGFTSTVGELLHAGHIVMLEQARKRCDWLIVGLLIDPTEDRPEKNKPVQSVLERYLQLKAVKYVDEVVPLQNEQDLYDYLLLELPHIRFVGNEYKDTPFTGHDIDGIQMCFNERRHSFSSTSLRKRIQEAENGKN